MCNESVCGRPDGSRILTFHLMKAFWILSILLASGGALTSSTAQSQLTPADSQAVAAAIVRVIVPELGKDQNHSGPLILRSGPMVCSRTGCAPDSTAPWLTYLRAEFRTQMPQLSLDSISPFQLGFRISSVAFRGDSAFSTISFARCSSPGGYYFWFYPLHLTLTRSNSQWHAAITRRGSSAHANC
jgi:hypothetical protein